MNNDITVTNDTLKKEDPEEHRDLLTEDFLRSLEDVSGVSQVYPLIYGQITVPWEPDFADLWMEEFYAKWMNIPYSDEAEEYKEYPENFGSVILGVSEAEFPYLQETVGAELDREEFLSGRSCVLYRNGLDLTMDDLAGKEVTCAEYGNGENTRTFQIAGLTDEGYYSGPMLGYPPTVIVSDAVVREFIPAPVVSKAGIRYAEEYDEQTEQEVLDLFRSSPDAHPGGTVLRRRVAYPDRHRGARCDVCSVPVYELYAGALCGAGVAPGGDGGVYHSSMCRDSPCRGSADDQEGERGGEGEAYLN